MIKYDINSTRRALKLEYLHLIKIEILNIMTTHSYIIGQIPSNKVSAYIHYIGTLYSVSSLSY
jgi:hypothetical protein